MNVSKDKHRAFCTFRDARKYLKKIFDKCWKMCILFLVRTKAFRLYGAPFCSPFSNFLHTFFDRKPHFPGLFVMNEKNSTDFWEFDEKRRRISKIFLFKLHKKLVQG